MKRYQKATEGVHAPGELKEKAVRPAGRRGYSRWIGAVAAVLVLAIIGGIALWPGMGVRPGPLAEDEGQEPAPLAEDNPIQPRTVPGSEGSGEVESSAGEERLTYSGGTHRAHALSMAAYPEMAPYPKDDEFVGADGSMDYDAWGDARDAWQDSINTLRTNMDFTGMMDGFLTTSTTQFLTGAGEENRIYSPLNVYMALSMLAETTGGNSRQQILDLLEVDSIEALRSQAAALWLNNYRDDGVVTSIMANSIWLRDDMTYSQDTLDVLSAKYYASSFAGEMGSEEYTQALRDWLNEQTHGLLEEQAGKLELVREMALALASTLYFKAAWNNEFSKENTAPQVFHAPSGDVETDFMNQTIWDGAYYWGEHFAAVQLSFQQSGGNSMWLILPDEGYTVDDLLESGEAMEFLMADKSRVYDEETGELVGVWPNQKRLMVNLSMPKFDVSSDLDLGAGLRALGVTDVFDVNVSNFDPLGAGTDDPIYVGKVQHAARVKVDEEGCEAAAYTVIMVYGTAMPPNEEVDFVLDRPFLFAVEGNGLPLFTGVVNQPNG